MTQAAAPQPIQPPDNFPVIWEYPNDGHRFWERETMHMPGQAKILDDSFQRRWCDAGFNAAAEDLSLPVRNAYRRINTYIYQSIAPVSHDLAELEALGREAQQRVGAPVSIRDIPATILDLVGPATSPPALPGVPLLGFADSRNTQAEYREIGRAHV